MSLPATQEVEAGLGAEPEEGVFEGGGWGWFALAVTSLSPVSSVSSPPGPHLPFLSDPIHPG